MTSILPQRVVARAQRDNPHKALSTVPGTKEQLLSLSFFFFFFLQFYVIFFYY